VNEEILKCKIFSNTAFKNIIDDKEWSRKMYTFAIWIAIIKVNIFTGQPISFNKCKINAIA